MNLPEIDGAKEEVIGKTVVDTQGERQAAGDSLAGFIFQVISD
jgi:hypothetical protein